MPAQPLALQGGPKTVTATLPEHHRWGREELARLTAMVRRHISELSIQEDVGPGKF